MDLTITTSWCSHGYQVSPFGKMDEGSFLIRTKGIIPVHYGIIQGGQPFIRGASGVQPHEARDP
jgi:hypothetical protein